MRARVALAFALIAGAMGLAGGEGAARADTPPSAWDRAKDPEAGDAYALHVEVTRTFLKIHQLGSTPTGHQYAAMFLPALRLKLERFGAEKHADIRLRLDLAEVYQELGTSEPALYKRSAEILRPALKEAPDHPMAVRGFMTLAFACGKLAEHACERDAYLEVIRRTDDRTGTYMTASLNLAETDMHLGDLKTAIEGYRETFRVASQSPFGDATFTLALTTWGLAVALDRSGDKVAAEREALLAVERERGLNQNRSLLHHPSVFFVPAYEVEYYDGLGYAARARASKSVRDARELWRRAEECFARYVGGAEREHVKDRWLEHAKARLREAKAEHENALKKREPNAPRRLGEDEDVTL